MIEFGMAFFGSLWALIVYSALNRGFDYFEYRWEIYRHKQWCKENDLPYIKPSDANKALEAFMDKPVEEFIETIRNDEEGEINNYKICPKCLEYKRNFMTEGRKRECMDCAIGSIGDN